MKTTFTSKCLALAVAAVSVTTCFSGHGQSVTATISGTPVSGGFDYTVVLHNTGSTNLNSFWYAWTTGGNNLATDPSTAGNSLGWANDLDANSIQWVNSTGTALAPGSSGTFTFFSSESPTTITTSPSGESVAYVHGIDFTEAVSGDSSAVFSPTLVAAPEPSPTALFGFGVMGLTAFGWVRFRRCK